MPRNVLPAMMQSPCVSICLPVFNGQQFLAAAIESVLVQTFRDFELIIIDDCSTDNSRQIVEHYASRDERIKYQSNSKKAGLFANYNLCIGAASGQYIKPFAQDDLLHSDMVGRLVALLDACPDVALVSTARTPICHRGIRITSATPQITAASYLMPSASVSGRQVIKRSLNPVVNFIGEPTTVMFRREHAGSGFDPNFYHLGDLEYWIRILLNGRYMYLDEELCSYRMHTASATTTNHKFMLYAADMLRLGRQYKRFIWEAGRTQEQFNDEVIETLASELNARGASFKNSLLNLESQYFADFAKQVDNEPLQSLPAGLLELALQALLRVSRAAPAPATQRTATIVGLENSLNDLLSSPSWRCTRGLRELNSNFLSAEIDEDDYQSESPKDYERYLRMQVKRVKNSRSWKLTTPLRVAARLRDTFQSGRWPRLERIES